MNYFLLQDDETLIHLPDCHFEEGRHEMLEIKIPIATNPPFQSEFIKGRKSFDSFTFTLPKGARLEYPWLNCLIVDENAILRVVLITEVLITESSTKVPYVNSSSTFPDTNFGLTKVTGISNEEQNSCKQELSTLINALLKSETQK
jgi:hypothetical protein